MVENGGQGPVNEEEWQAVRRHLAAYALPPEPPGAEQAFWQRLAPRLPERAPRPLADPALFLPPVAMVLGLGLCQVVAASLGAFTLFGGWQTLGPWAQRAGLAALLSSLLRGIASALGWEQGWPLLGRRLAEGLSRPGAGSLALVGSSFAAWAIVLVLALFYWAWVFLWLRPQQAPEAVNGG